MHLNKEKLLEFDEFFKDLYKHGSEEERLDQLQQFINDIEENSQKNQDSDDEYKVKYTQLLSEFQNYRKRQENLSQEIKTKTKSDLLENLLPVLDTFELALVNADEDNPTIKGIIWLKKCF